MNERPIDRLGLPRVKRSHTFLRWQRRQLARECYRAGLRREQICLRFAGYPKRRAAMSGLGRKRLWLQASGLIQQDERPWDQPLKEPPTRLGPIRRRVNDVHPTVAVRAECDSVVDSVLSALG